jgi:hypothetical protein
MKKNLIYTFVIVLVTILYCLTLLCNIFKESINISLNILSIFGFSVLIIPLFFVMLSEVKVLKIKYYYGLQLIYTFLPFGLFTQYTMLNNSYVTMISLTITLVISIFLYLKLKNINIVHFKYLSYSNFVLTSFFTIFFAMIGLLKNGIETRLFLTCISPLLVLQIIYKKYQFKWEIMNAKPSPNGDAEQVILHE